jgi:hypothetical protein
LSIYLKTTKLGLVKTTVYDSQIGRNPKQIIFEKKPANLYSKRKGLLQKIEDYYNKLT